MRHFLAVALAFLPLALAAQDDPLETHLYNVEFLTVETTDHPGQMLGLVTETIGVAVAEESALDHGLLSGEDLIQLIKTNVAEDTWEHVASQISFQRGVLTVTNHKSVHTKITQYLNYWRGMFGKMITLDSLVISVDPLLLARTRAAGNPERPAILPPEHLKQLLDAAREGKLAELVKRMRITAHPGQRVSLQDIAKQQYLQDVDVQIATASAALSPVVGQLSTGTSIDVRPTLEPFADGVTLEVRADLAELDAVEERKLRLTRELTPVTPVETEPGKTSGQPRAGAAALVFDPKIQLPKVSSDRVRTMLTVKNRETAIVGSMLRRGRMLLFLLTPAIVAADDRPAPEPVFDEQRLLKIFDISPLTRGVPDWPGPRMDLGVTRAMTGAMAATFTLDEPKVQMASDDIEQMIKTRISPDSWGNKRNHISSQGGTLIIRQKPEVLREIERFLTTILMARAQMVTSDAVVIGFKKGSRADWENEIPALGSGGLYVETEKFDKLFEEALKGKNVRLVDAGEVTGFPQERVHASRGQSEAFVAQYEAQVATAAALHDPIVDTVAGGFVLDVRPHFVHGNEQIGVDFRSALVVAQTKDIDPLGGATSAMQLVGARVLRWNSNVLCVKGKYSLVALETVGRGDDAEDLAVFLRARQNVLK